ncbi:TPA: glycoside hydrolase [Candidatus Poribacteria bacterium]|nr:glycoside hydrolase [Candidatus Poribacteria bacterium]
MRSSNNIHTNSLGIQFVRIESGTFRMGIGKTPLPSELTDNTSQQQSWKPDQRPYLRNGDFDEHPSHTVKITQPFQISSYQVTNIQYEQFDPTHRELRDKLGFSQEDDEAVVFISWYDAVNFCQWLSKKEGVTYRLPTEAEWEYACRAGTTTYYHTGDSLPEEFYKNANESWYPSVGRGGGPEEEVVPLTVGQTPPNSWGVSDMHGNVEEWCYDWYGPYEEVDQVDPVGRENGLFRVTRGGSHSTPIYYLRSSNRLGTLPEDKSWLIGFRLVMGELPQSDPLPSTTSELWAQEVSQTQFDWSEKPTGDQPCFTDPKPFIHVPDPDQVPTFGKHNHQPSITWCPNGDLLAIWFSTYSERGREMTVMASRLRCGHDEWDRPSEFFNAPDRNLTGAALYNDGQGQLHHFNGLAVAGTWGPLALVMRTSTDNGYTWSVPRLIGPEHQNRHQVISGTSRTQEGYLIQPCDAVPGGSGGTAIHISRDGGQTWNDPGVGKPKPEFANGQTGAWIAGIHAGVVQLRDGRLLAFGRGDTIDDRMPMSVSKDMGETWIYSPSPFPPIGGGQRLVLLRLREGPLFLASFTGDRKDQPPMEVTDTTGQKRSVTGLFAAVSLDEGQTWSNIRLISHDGPDRQLETTNGTPFTMGISTAEPGGYLAGCQCPDGLIHLISSKQHYTFNLAWLTTPPPAVEA